MNTQNLIIYKFSKLYHILKEIELDLNFNILFVDNENILNDTIKNLNNYLIITDRENLNFGHQFILNNTPWAHLDIAGMAFSKYGGALNSGGATGYGVRLLNKLIEENYE